MIHQDGSFFVTILAAEAAEAVTILLLAAESRGADLAQA